MTKLCNTCEYLKFCARSGIETVGCDRYKKDTTTNEEWLKHCNTEQLAEFIIKAMLFYDNAGITVLEAIKNAVEDNEKLGSYFMESVLEWLKQQHTPKE